MNKKRPLPRQTSEEGIRKIIVLEHKEGREAAEIANDVHYHIKSVQRIIRNFSKKKNYKRRKGGGRLQKLSRNDKIRIRNRISNNPWLTAKEIANELEIKVSAETIRKYLKSQGYRWKKPVQKPQLTKANKTLRFNWALRHKNYNFSNVIFADESSFWLHGHIQNMWIKKGQEYIVETVSHPSKVHVWGFLQSDGILTIETFQENLDADLLVTLMRESLTRGANRDFGTGNWALAYDNDPKHRAGDTLKYLRRAKVN